MRTRRVSAALASLLLGSVAHAGGIAESIGIVDFTYAPATVTIQAGQTVAVAATAFHPLRVDANAAIECAVDCNLTFLTPGTYGFFCVNHGGPGGIGMAGSVTVTAGDSVFAGTMEHTVL